MKRATRFMRDTVSCEGGYVWSYTTDLSRRWGELEARPTMIWIQGSGTPAMGHAFLDAFEATRDEFYFEAASDVARVLIRVQHPAGGWNYCADLAGEASLREWYATVGANAWRLEEFQHYYGNATFDDSVTSSAGGFLLRFHATRPNPEVRAAVERVIAFILDSQYPSGGWPQRFPIMAGFNKDGHSDYSAYCTFNDDVAAGNIAFLERCAMHFSDPRIAQAIRRGREAFILARQEPPQAGWALQYTPDLRPAGARTYEPRALATHASADNIRQLFRFYRETGDRAFLECVEPALDWLDSVALTSELRQSSGRSHPTFVELGTNRPLFIHRSGSNAVNGRYYVDDEPGHTIAHYASFRHVDVAALRAELSTLSTQPWSPPKSRDPAPRPVSAAEARRVVAALNSTGYWPAMLEWTSHPYRGPASREVAPGDYSRTFVGDTSDTSPFLADKPQPGISTKAYIRSMRVLVQRLRELRDVE